MPPIPQDTFEKRQRQRKKQEAKADKAWRRQLRREDRQNRPPDGVAPPESEQAPEESVEDREAGPESPVDPIVP